MSFVIRFRPEIVDDLEDAARWYDSRQPGLASEFLHECRRACDHIVEHPEYLAPVATGIRSLRLHRFPFVLHYRLEGTTVVVFAIMFGGRDPSAWQDRQ
jgi:plasmid stabilization system protein ParE